jgi:hypothetical protein
MIYNIDELTETQERGLVRGCHHMHAAPDCSRWSNQTEGEEQHRAYRPPGHEGEASTDAGKHAEQHLMKVCKIFRTAIAHGPDVVLTLENPHAGMQFSHIMNIVERPRRTGGLGLTKLTLRWTTACMTKKDRRRPQIYGPIAES